MEYLKPHLVIVKEDLIEQDFLGSGSYGAVFKGLWNKLGQSPQPVAIKKLRFPEEKGMIGACLEVEIMSLVKYAHICEVYGGCVISPNELWIIMEYVDGGDLHCFLSSFSSHPSTTSPSFSNVLFSDSSLSSYFTAVFSPTRLLLPSMPEELELWLCLQAAQAVAHLHSLSSPILHRDIKSLNFLLTKGRRLILTDFGFAKPKMDAFQTMAGTLAWLAPEIALSKSTWSEKSDIFSLGMVLFEIVSKLAPFSGLNQVEIVGKIMKKVRPTIPDECPEYLSSWIKRCWDQDPSRRPKAVDIVKNLQQLLDQTLFSACWSQNLPTIKMLLEAGVNPNTTELESGSTLLHISTMTRNLDLSQLLLTYGASVTAVNNYKKTPLHVAARLGYAEIVVLLAEHGADVNATDGFNQTPMHCVIDCGEWMDILATIVALVNQGANVHAKEARGYTVLHLAAGHGLVDLVRYFLARGVDVNARDLKERTTLHRASIYGHHSTAQLLLEQGADVNAVDISGNTSLHLTKSNNEMIVEVLISMGGDINIKNHAGITPLHAAAKRGRVKRCLLLLERGANVNARDCFKQTPLFHTQSGEVAMLLMEKGVDVSAVDASGKTALQCALEGGFDEVVKVLREWTGESDCCIQ